MSEELPVGWRRTALGALVRPSRARATPNPHDKRAYLGLEHVEAHTSRLLGFGAAGAMKSSGIVFEAGDVLYGRLRPYLNKVARPTFGGVCSAEFMVFAGSAALDPGFLLHRLSASDFVHFSSSLNAGDRPRVDFEQLAEFVIDLPPLPEQRRIVAAIEEHISDLDAGVAALHRVQANLKRYRASVLKAAVEGRLGGSVPGPDKREIERGGWVTRRVDELASRVTVGHVGPMKSRYTSEGVPFLRSQNVRENRFDATGLLRIPAEFHRELSKSRLTPGDVVVVRSGAVGTACVVPSWLGEANCSDLVIIQRPTGVLPEFLAYHLNSASRAEVRRGQVGIALAHFNTKAVAALPIHVPPMTEQMAIVDEVQRRLSAIEATETTLDAQLHRAARLRQSILKRAFEGKLVPQDARDPVAEVAEVPAHELPAATGAAAAKSKGRSRSGTSRR